MNTRKNVITRNKFDLAVIARGKATKPKVPFRVQSHNSTGKMSLRANYKFAKQSHINLLFLSLIILLFILSCIKPAPYEPQGRKGLSDSKDEVYIINGLAETISIINCKDLSINNDVMETGMWPNYLAFKGNMGYLVNSGENNIQVFDEDSLELSYSIDIGVNSNPWMILFRPGTDTAFVPNFVLGDLAVIRGQVI